MNRNRLRILSTLLLAAFAAIGAPAVLRADHHEPSKREIYELRVYQLTSVDKAAAFDSMMKEATIPALKRLGAGPVGIFKQKPGANKEAAPGSEHWRYVLARYQSFEQFSTVREKLAKDSEFLAAAEEFLSAKKSDPSYARIESSLLLAFAGMPKLAAPAAAKEAGKRFFELRTYESHSEAAAHLKVDMFNSAELDIFKKTGLKPVFFGQALAAFNLPQLTYMLVHDSEEAKAAAWKAFIQSPEWKELKEVEKYKNTVSKIIAIFLVPVDGSGIR